MAKKNPSQASVGQAVLVPRLAIRAITATTEPKNSSPGRSWSEVGCHSVIRAVTRLFVESPSA